MSRPADPNAKAEARPGEGRAISEPAVRRKGSLWRTVQAVAWGFFGVRRHSDYQEDIARLTPLHIVAVGFVAALLLVLGLVLLVRFVAAP